MKYSAADVAYSPLSSARVPVWMWGILLLLHGLFFGWQLGHQSYGFPDSGRYLMAAHNLRTAGVLYAEPLTGLPLSAQEYSIRPPGYPVLLILLGATTTAIPVAVLLLQNLLSLLNVGLALQWIARRRPTLRQWQWGVLLGLAIVPGQFIYANALMSEILLQSCIVGLWLSLTAFFANPQRHWVWVLGAILAALALLIKPVFFPFAGLFLALGGWVSWKQRRLRLFLIGCIPVVVALGWQARNAKQTGYFHFSSIAEINLLRYNVRAVLQKTEGYEAAEQFVATTVAAAESQPTFAAQQHYIRKQSQAVLLRHPVAYAALHGQGMLNLLLDPGRFDLVHFFGLPERNTAGLLGQFAQHGYAAMVAYVQRLPLGLLAILLLVIATNVVRLLLLLRFAACPLPWAWRLPLLGLVLYVALLTGPLGAARFAVPILPLLLAAAGLSLPQRRTGAPGSSSEGALPGLSQANKG